MTEDLFNALSALCDMWDQYCPMPCGHAFMSAGEHAEYILDQYNLLKEKNGGGGVVDWDRLGFIKTLIPK